MDRSLREAEAEALAGDLGRTPSAPPSTREQLREWVVIGTTSVGGGPSTLYMLRSVLVGRRGWLTMREFVQDWTLSRLSIGNHLAGLAALIGQRIGGRRGVVVAVAGLLIPAGTITALMAGGFGLIRDQPAIQATLAGVAPVTIGMMLAISAMLIRTITGPRSWSLVLDLVVFLLAAAAGFLVTGSTILVIISGAVIGVLFLGRDDVPPETVEG